MAESKRYLLSMHDVCEHLHAPAGSLSIVFGLEVGDLTSGADQHRSISGSRFAEREQSTLRHRNCRRFVRKVKVDDHCCSVVDDYLISAPALGSLSNEGLCGQVGIDALHPSFSDKVDDLLRRHELPDSVRRENSKALRGSNFDVGHLGDRNDAKVTEKRVADRAGHCKTRNPLRRYPDPERTDILPPSGNTSSHGAHSPLLIRA
mmetsp:Transcript_5500/g.16402  ORF Transcript_5500/g.16402 Transcript_5500/m.16402 type:complete len:205 (-) Transcript_5500:1030-1644(-)